MNVNMTTKECDLDIQYGMFNLRTERDAARSSLKYILTDVTDIKEQYVRLGFHLWEFKHCKYYEDFGYATFQEFCEANIPLDKGAISRCMNVWYEFAYIQDGSRKMFLDSKYKDYSYSQLQELLPLDDKKRKLVKPEMTVKEIRAIKKTLPALSASAVALFVGLYKNVVPFTREFVLRAMENDGKTHRGGARSDLSYSMKPGKVSINGSDYYSFKTVLDIYEKNGGAYVEDSCDVATASQDAVPEKKSADFDCAKFQKCKGAALSTYCEKFVDESVSNDICLVFSNGSKVTYHGAKFINDCDDGTVVFYLPEKGVKYNE